MRASFAAAMLLISLLCGCVSSPEGAVSHVVVCWLKQPGDPTGRQALIDRTKELGKIPGVKHVAVGTSLPSTRPVVDSSFDVALVLTFEDEQALRAYDEHPIHKQAVKEVLAPLVARFVIYDFVNR